MPTCISLLHSTECDVKLSALTHRLSRDMEIGHCQNASSETSLVTHHLPFHVVFLFALLVSAMDCVGWQCHSALCIFTWQLLIVCTDADCCGLLSSWFHHCPMTYNCQHSPWLCILSHTAARYRTKIQTVQCQDGSTQKWWQWQLLFEFCDWGWETEERHTVICLGDVRHTVQHDRWTQWLQQLIAKVKAECAMNVQSLFSVYNCTEWQKSFWNLWKP